ncbi:MAG: hypothetical protein SWO11_06615 [Thermodesulfobacteriota bacterium]|nr:hypothetical protein [Thermodesulfobacteriota bacterium]
MDLAILKIIEEAGSYIEPETPTDKVYRPRKDRTNIVSKGKKLAQEIDKV